MPGAVRWGQEKGVKVIKGYKTPSFKMSML